MGLHTFVFNNVCVCVFGRLQRTDVIGQLRGVTLCNPVAGVCGSVGGCAWLMVAFRCRFLVVDQLCVATRVSMRI